MTATMADVRDMYVVHIALRREFGLLPALVRAVADGDVARSELVGGHIQLLCDLLHEHHQGEDDLLWPKLLDRVAEEIAPVVHTMEEQHGRLDKINQELLVVLPLWRATAAPEQRAELASALDELNGALVEHTAMEEAQILPLAAKHVTAAEWRQLGRNAMANLPKKRLPLVFGVVMYEGDPEVIRGIVAEMPLVPRLLMPIVGPRRYAAHAKRVHGTATPPRAAAVTPPPAA
ncbi:hemerythrin domain-containing protein [Plantactinospora sp. CA-290183]|uniref:hemerythrin domain-containing protein n=1 Tax=Plantactinospora sp. CA-290183 TaxID=3240006 RepID=UPI003D8D169A